MDANAPVLVTAVPTLPVVCATAEHAVYTHAEQQPGDKDTTIEQPSSTNKDNESDDVLVYGCELWCGASWERWATVQGTAVPRADNETAEDMPTLVPHLSQWISEQEREAMLKELDGLERMIADMPPIGQLRIMLSPDRLRVVDGLHARIESRKRRLGLPSVPG